MRTSAPPRQVPGRGLLSRAADVGRVLISVANRDKRSIIFPLKRLTDLGFEIVATAGTADVLRRHGIPVTVIRKHYERDGEGPDTVEAIRDGAIDLIMNTPFGVGARLDGYEIRTAAVVTGVPCITTVQGLGAAVQGIEGSRRRPVPGASVAGIRRRVGGRADA